MANSTFEETRHWKYVGTLTQLNQELSIGDASELLVTIADNYGQVDGGRVIPHVAFNGTVNYVQGLAVDDPISTGIGAMVKVENGKIKITWWWAKGWSIAGVYVYKR